MYQSKNILDLERDAESQRSKLIHCRNTGIDPSVTKGLIVWYASWLIMQAVPLVVQDYHNCETRIKLCIVGPCSVTMVYMQAVPLVVLDCEGVKLKAM